MKIQVKVIEIIKEDAYCSVGNTSGMGSVVSPQPSTNSGSTFGSDFSNGGGTVGSGDISGGFNRTPYQKSPVSKKKKKTKLFNKIQDYTKGFKKLKKFKDFN